MSTSLAYVATHGRNEESTYTGIDILSKARPPKNIYSSKRRHDPKTFFNSSSPLEEASDDISLNEMSSRMMKKSRLALRDAENIDRAYELGPSDKKRRRISKPHESHLIEDCSTEVPDSISKVLNTRKSAANADISLGAVNLGKVTKDKNTPAYSSPSSLLSRKINISSHKLKENDSSGLVSGLASPFRDRAPNFGQKGRNNTSQSKFKRNQSAALSRRQSSNAARLSATFHRHPSGSQALSQKVQQDWLVPAQIVPALSKNPTAFSPDASIDFSFFISTSPQACSTPMSVSRSLSTFPGSQHSSPVNRNGSPNFAWSYSKMTLFNDTDVIMNDTTPKVRSKQIHDEAPITALGLSATSVSKTQEKTKEKETVSNIKPNQKDQLRHTTGFPAQSSLNGKVLSPEITSCCLKSTATPQNNAQLVSTVSSPISGYETISSDGDELRDMFSILGLDVQEEERWKAISNESRTCLSSCHRSQDTIKSTSKKSKRGKKSSLTGQRVVKLSSATNRKGKSLAGQHISTKKSFEKHGELALSMAPDDDEDELLLTYRGWDWDPNNPNNQ